MFKDADLFDVVMAIGLLILILKAAGLIGQ